MTLEDLVLERYRVERAGEKMVAIKDSAGLYMAHSAEQIERALNTRCRIRKTDHIFVRAWPKSETWRAMTRRY